MPDSVSVVVGARLGDDDNDNNSDKQTNKQTMGEHAAVGEIQSDVNTLHMRFYAPPPQIRVKCHTLGPVISQSVSQSLSVSQRCFAAGSSLAKASRRSDARQAA